MRFISKYRQFEFVAIPTVTIAEANMYGQKARRGVVCKFRHIGRGALPWEIDAALQHFKFSGLGHDEDPRNRLSYLDTDEEARERGWDADTKKQVERRLVEAAATSPDFILVERPALPSPWPNYLTLTAHGRRTKEMVADRIAELVVEFGVDPKQVIEFERQQNRVESEAIIARMEGLVGERDEAEPLIAA